MSEKIPVKHIEPGTQNLEIYSGSGGVADGPRTVDLYESREKIYVRQVKGLFQQVRTISLWLLMLGYFALCWISIDGQQLIHFDLPGRKFHIVGITFWPQDFFLLSVLLIISAFGLFFITTLFGRIWCGYTCPQTAWTFIFIWLEEKTEGSRNQRMKLDAAPMSMEKFTRKGLKHLLWFLVAFGTGLTFVGYFYPIRELVPDLLTLSATSAWSYFWVAFFTIATYVNAGWLREQVCLYMCPYARFQSVMFDPDTLIVSYDPERGESRGSRKRTADHKAMGLGDCVDCGQCVQVCPTGIDIRDGLQYECIGCARCIDACDQIMEKMNYDKGLISYTTEKQLEGKTSKIVRPKSIAYAAVLTVFCIGFWFSVFTRVPVELDVNRDRGALFQLTGMGQIENSYTLKIANKSNETHRFVLSVSGIDGLIITTQSEVTVASGEVYTLPTSLEVNPTNMQTSRYDIMFTVQAVGAPEIVTTVESRFLGDPNS